MKYFLTVFVAFILSQGILADKLAKKSERITPQKISGLKEARVPKEAILDNLSDEFDSKDDAMSRRELGDIISDTVNIKPGGRYYTDISGRSCVKFSVTSTPEDLRMGLMDGTSFYFYQTSDYDAQLLTFVQGSQCLGAYTCIRTISGLNPFKRYYLVLLNDYDGASGGDDARADVSISTCPSPSPSPSPSTSPSPLPSTSPSSYSPSYSSLATRGSGLVSFVLAMVAAIYMM